MTNDRHDGEEPTMAHTSWNELRATRAKDIPDFEGKVRREQLNAVLAELVYDLRTNAGLTQTQLADMIGTKQPNIARIEGGAVTPTLELLGRIGDALNVQFFLTAETPTRGGVHQVPVNAGSTAHIDEAADTATLA